ncbi:type VI-B CRISPR-associated RNA-guided ribonuclease Cas13b [Prevotella intermedia]|uniref:type VI-B CRISPR-associated RNA-guided ribonuclease Cas13b n=1 Tax=Prevotella intermedia TaxID=28131 RepID=UPI0019551328|nr:type VI-B CRISPR-associated RNA-guided ribonuclease Cas13b [Prevotella intermedia]
MEDDKKTTESTNMLDNKHFWAAFLNLARHNVYITVNHINKVLELKNKKDQDIIIDNDQDILAIKTHWEKVNGDLNKTERLRELMTKHFPFLETAIYTKNKEDKKEVKQEKQAKAQSFDSLKHCLFLFLEKLQEARNYYSHYKYSESTKEPMLEKELLKKMYNIFDDNIQLVIKDYQHNKDINPDEDFKHLDRTEEDFNYYFTRNKKGNITASGLLFFVSLFLEKKDAIWMQQKLRGFKDNRESKKKMTHEVFCRSRMLLPKLRLESTQTQDWILLDMLNELIRCPKSLYERLQGDDRKKFNVPFDPTDENYDAEQEPFKNTLVRHQDRFPYFALRYFDYNEVFANLRFQIDLGTYHFSIYKKLIGGQKEDRHLTHKLYGFERIQEFAKQNRPDEWKAIVKDLDTYETSEEPYISETTPHYHLENQKIGIRFRNGNNDIWPSLETNGENNEKSKYKLDKQYQAEAFLSVHELLPMMFYYLLLKKEKPNNDEINASIVEGFIKREIRYIYKLYDAFANGEINNIDDLKKYCEDKGIPKRNLPKQMIAILESKPKDMVEEAERKQRKMVKDTKKLLATLEKQTQGEIEDGGRNIRLLKSGEIARWLVNDMMRFQPVQKDNEGNPLNNSKANSTEYQMLQRSLALYNKEEKPTRYFRQVNLIESSNPHPFLNNTEWKECNNILSFYRSYLTKKIEFLNELKPEDWEKNQYFLKLKEPKTNRETLVQGWKNGFNLPRGIFTEPIREWFKRHQNDSKEYEKVEALKRVGLVTKVIPLFFKEEYFKEDAQKEINNCVQPFYGFPYNVGNIHKPKEEDFLHREERIELWDKKKDKFKGYKAKKKFKEMTDKEKEEHRSYLEFKSWNQFERELRLVRNQDIVTWLLCMELIDKLKVEGLNVEELQKLRLKDIDTDTAKQEKNNILNRVMPMQLPVTVYEIDDSHNIVKDRPLHTVYIEETKTKLLKQGNFKALVKDRRLNGLFSFVDTSSEAELKSNPISKLRVEYELGEYQNARIEIIEDMLALEGALIEKDKNLPTDNFSDMLNGWLEGKDESDKARFQNDVKLLVAVRNAFSHNQYPMRNRIAFANINPFSLSSADISEEKGLDIANQLKDKTHKIIKRIIKIEKPIETKE